MERMSLRFFAVLLATCFLVPYASGAPAMPSAADELWAVMDATQQDLGLFWAAMNVSGYVQNKNFATLAQGNFTILAPGNSTLIKYVEQMGLTLADLATPNVTALLYPLMEYHVVKGWQNFTELPLQETTSFDTLLTGTTNALCPAGPVNVTKVSAEHAVVSTGGSYAIMNITATGPLSSNDKYAVYGLDQILSPCCLDIDFSSLDLTTFMNSPELSSYISGVDLTTILPKITDFLTYALKFIKENGQKLNSMPFTVILPFPDAIAAALDDVTDKTEATYQAIFLNHVIPQTVGFDTIAAAGGSLTVSSMLDQMYAPFSCNNSLTASVDPSANDASQFLPSFNTVSTSAAYKLCNGGIIYFADDVIVPCNLTDAVFSVANNLTTDAKASQSGAPAPSTPGSSTSSPSGTPSGTPAASTTGNTTTRVATASPAAAVTPLQWVMNLVLACSLLLAVL